MSLWHEVTKVQNLLDVNGHIAEPGWSKQLTWKYARNQIKAPKWRIKEWDYYLIVGKDHACAFTISDLGYLGMISFSMLDFKTNENHTKSIITLFPMGKFNLPTDSSKGDVIYQDKHISLSFLKKEGIREIHCQLDDLEGESFTCSVTLQQPHMDTMCIATPWSEKPDHFYYNQKINCMAASGTAKYGNREYVFDADNDYGTLDWGRGVWTYDNTWYWSNGNMNIEGKPFGFNLGYGFTDRSSATENILYYDGKASKLDEITFVIPKNTDGSKDYLSPWMITSNDGRFECEMRPVMDRNATTKVGPILTLQHQVFARASGRAVLDNDQVIEFKDMLMFAEDVRNKY